MQAQTSLQETAQPQQAQAQAQPPPPSQAPEQQPAPLVREQQRPMQVRALLPQQQALRQLPSVQVWD